MSSLRTDPTLRDPRHWLDLLTAAIELARARLLLGEAVPIRSLARQPLPDGAASARAERVRLAIARVSPRVPWKSDCLVQARAAQHWLDRLGIPSRLSIGAPLAAAQDWKAHAWLDCGSLRVTGGTAEGYVSLEQAGEHSEGKSRGSAPASRAAP